MRILIWHGYLLGGTGSNVYTRSLARTWARQGHDVVVLCQDPHPELTRPRRRRGGPSARSTASYRSSCSTATRTPIRSCSARWTPAARQRFVEVNAAAVRAQLPADLVLVNHVLLGAPVGAAAGAPFVVKAHGSELEYAMRGRARPAAVGPRDPRRRPTR